MTRENFFNSSENNFEFSHYCESRPLYYFDTGKENFGSFFYLSFFVPPLSLVSLIHKIIDVEFLANVILSSSSIHIDDCLTRWKVSKFLKRVLDGK